METNKNSKPENKMIFQKNDMIEGKLGNGIGNVYGQVLEVKERVHVKVKCEYGMPSIRKMWVSAKSIKHEER